MCKFSSSNQCFSFINRKYIVQLSVIRSKVLRNRHVIGRSLRGLHHIPIILISYTTLFDILVQQFNKFSFYANRTKALLPILLKCKTFTLLYTNTYSTNKLQDLRQQFWRNNIKNENILLTSQGMSKEKEKEHGFEIFNKYENVDIVKTGAIATGFCIFSMKVHLVL